VRDEGTAARAAGRCPHAGAAWRGPSTEPGGPADLPGAALRERVTHLYNCQGLSTYQIAGIVGISRQRVGRMLRAAGVPVKPRGSGRRRRAARPDLDQLMADLYLQFGLSSIRIAELLGIPGRTVRERLRSLGVPMPSRGGFSREDRLSVPAEAIAALYVRSGLSAREVGEIFGVSHRIVLRAAHDMGLPVRVGGPPTRGGPEEIELVEALYADPAVQHTLQRHGAPRVPPGGTIWQRFPVALRVTPELAEELYVSCGLGLHHIELMTGQAAATIGRELVNSGIELRHAGGRSPFLRRWRTGAASRGQRA
jgi:transposase